MTTRNKAFTSRTTAVLRKVLHGKAASREIKNAIYAELLRRKRALKLFVLALCVSSAACSATDTGDSRVVRPNEKRYRVERADQAPGDSRIHTIETIRDTHTGICYMIVSTVGGAVGAVVQCEPERNQR